MRLIALLLVRGVPMLLIFGVVVYVLDLGGARQPMSDAYISAAERVAQHFADQFKEAVAPTPSATPRP